MTSPGDMGGRSEFYGPVVVEADEPTFHEPWEGRVFGMSVFLISLLGRNVDAFRFALERLPREVYLSGYYRRWLAGLECRLTEAGHLRAGEVDAWLAGHPAQVGGRGASPIRRELTSRALRLMLRPQSPRWLVGRVLPRVLGTTRKAPAHQRFSVGDRVRVRDTRAPGHTRQPGYVSGKPGVVVTHLGCTVFPDAHAVGRRTPPQHLYTVTFDAADLWGDAAEPGTEMRVDL
ncbi:MAG: nitrile hydratase subunit beta, partial [Mycolicibacterium sp.]|nr:nitrile hydratase subunit beta [Mycolicibacterium sp.]